MGYERKRGKLAELNSLLRGGGQDCFSLIVGTTDVLSSVKYVITLDTDTQLPRDSARQFVGAMAHPLNRAHFDEERQLVTEGYGILQPRVAVSLPGTNRSRYARLFGSEPGIDPYTRAVSDVYQDVFGEGSFIGKGIYDVDAFERSLKGRFPENRILSHDLLEGCYARSGLLSDVQLYEEYPSRYSADVSRRHRWIRGDWQIASWLLSRVPGNRADSDAGRRQNPLSALSQWKIFDNLRRSLVPAALTLLLLLGWTILSAAWFWTLVVIGIILIPPLIASILDLFRKPDDVLLGQHLAAALRSAGRHFAQAVLTLACLPYEAYFSLDAIMRTNWRILVTQKDCWNGHPRAARIAMITPAWSPATGRCGSHPLSPSPSAVLSGGIDAGHAGSGGTDSAPLDCLARNRLVDQPAARPPRSAADGRPDHFSAEDFAQDLGVLRDLRRPGRSLAAAGQLSGASGCRGRASHLADQHGALRCSRICPPTTSATFRPDSSSSARRMRSPRWRRLERHQGHFYNWYDTQSLQPLPPLYISSVDSGNLAGHLLTLRPGLLALPDHKILGARLFDGLIDTLRVLVDAAAEAPPAALVLLDQLQKDLESAYDSRPATLAAARTWLARLAASAAEVAASLDAGNSRDRAGERRAVVGAGADPAMPERPR